MSAKEQFLLKHQRYRPISLSQDFSDEEMARDWTLSERDREEIGKYRKSFRLFIAINSVRFAADIAQTGTVPGAVNLSLGSLTYLADNEVPESWRHPQLADRARPIITTCILGPMGALGGKLLHDMGFRNVQVLEGGVQARIDAGLPVAKNGAG